VIIGRALPDVRDGLKPVHRRVLYAMWEQGQPRQPRLQEVRPHRRRRHGQVPPARRRAIYDTVVRMAQDFSMRYPLVDGQGNFGSVDGDPPAAMRYTEVRLTALAEELLATTSTRRPSTGCPTTTAREIEPHGAAGEVPNLLVNGSSGIAVGMATNIPPHNLGEVVDACDAADRHPEATSTS
jgi:DNA gyrase subunit A